MNFCGDMNTSVVDISDFFELVGELQQFIDLMGIQNNTDSRVGVLIK
jgi:hypothetical protein